MSLRRTPTVDDTIPWHHFVFLDTPLKHFRTLEFIGNTHHHFIDDTAVEHGRVFFVPSDLRRVARSFCHFYVLQKASSGAQHYYKSYGFTWVSGRLFSSSYYFYLSGPAGHGASLQGCKRSDHVLNRGTCTLGLFKQLAGDRDRRSRDSRYSMEWFPRHSILVGHVMNIRELVHKG